MVGQQPSQLRRCRAAAPRREASAGAGLALVGVPRWRPASRGAAERAPGKQGVELAPRLSRAADSKALGTLASRAGESRHSHTSTAHEL